MMLLFLYNIMCWPAYLVHDDFSILFNVSFLKVLFLLINSVVLMLFISC